MRSLMFVGMMVFAVPSLASGDELYEKSAMRLAVTYQCIGATGDRAAYEMTKAEVEEKLGSRRTAIITDHLEQKPPRRGKSDVAICAAMLEMLDPL